LKSVDGVAVCKTCKTAGSGDGSFYPSMQHHYCRLIYYYIILLHVSVVRPSSGKHILIARVSQLTTDPLFYNIANIIVIVLYIQLC
jgi:hypothetical protein